MGTPETIAGASSPVMQAIEAARRRLGYPDTIDMAPQSLLALLDDAIARHGDHPACTCMGHTLSFRELDRLSRRFAAWLQQETDLQPGDRIAIQLPNILQYPLVAWGVWRAGLVIVNTNPLYTPREMEHQFVDAGARAIVILANMAHKLEEVLPKTLLQYVIVTELGDLHPAPRRWAINTVVRHVKKMVPPYHLPAAFSLRAVLEKGDVSRWRPPAIQSVDLAVLQYTGGTTGVAKGAMLTHANLQANLAQCAVFLDRASIRGPGETAVAPLPLYHIYSFMVHCLLLPSRGVHSLLITNPRDIPGFIAELARQPFTMFVGINTLFAALLNDDHFRRLDFSSLKLTLAGGMALMDSVARHWQETTGCAVVEGYGLTESSPVLTLNPQGHVRAGSIGIPVANTAIRIVDEHGADLPCGEAGELCAQGPQVMKGYWQREQATAETVVDGWLHTGDIAKVNEDGFLFIVDRKKDMIIVSGFNVYPNEIENVMSAHPDIVECAAIGVPDALSGEAVKLFVVSRNAALDADQLRHWARERLTAYKIPRHVEFRESLPKSNVGKILRRELRD